MRYLFSFISCFCLLSFASAQSDTVYTYYSPLWKPTVKDSAAFYVKRYWQNQLLKKDTYRADSNMIQFSASFRDSAGRIEKGYFVRYNRAGQVRDSIYIDSTFRKEGWYFYFNGKRKAYFHAVAPGKYDVQKGWDENGKEIPGYIAYQAALFPGGDTAWKSYLLQSLTINQPAEYSAGKISGVVEVLFTVAGDGTVKDVRLGKTSGYEALDNHAIEVIKNSPKWIPGIQFNNRVRYFQRQTLTYAPLTPAAQ